MNVCHQRGTPHHADTPPARRVGPIASPMRSSTARCLTAGPRGGLGVMLVALAALTLQTVGAAAAAPDDRSPAAGDPAADRAAADRPTDATRTGKGPANAGETMVLFNGKTLDRWQVTDFAGHGEVTVRDGRMILDMGADLTGVTYRGKLPVTNYEVTLEAMRVAGTDFFCGLTFPVGDSHCSLIVGGWGGTIVGLSSVDNYDASENETTQYLRFKKGRWYAIRVRVTDEKIEAWIDKDQVVDLPRKDRTFSVRIEVEPSRPFGIASWQTRAALRNIKVRRLTGRK